MHGVSIEYACKPSHRDLDAILRSRYRAEATTQTREIGRRPLPFSMGGGERPLRRNSCRIDTATISLTDVLVYLGIQGEFSLISTMLAQEYAVKDQVR
jgi:hypothetical protein